jgi:hypothetical protein
VNDAWMVWLALVSVVLLAGGVLAYAWTRGRLGVVSAVLLVVAIAAWIVDVAAVTTDFRDADGFVDCADTCTATHRLAALGFVTPPLLVALAAAGMTVALVARGRRRRRAA